MTKRKSSDKACLNTIVRRKDGHTFVCLRDDGNIGIVDYVKGKGEQQIITDKKSARSIMNQIRKCLFSV